MWTSLKDDITKISDTFKRWKVLLPGSVGTAAVGVVLFMLSPIKQRAFDYFWPPHPMIDNELVSIHRPVLRGDRFAVRLHLVAEAGKKLPSGMVKVIIEGSQVDTSSRSVVDVDGNDSSKDIEFDFAAHGAGEARMIYEYTSNEKRIAVKPVQVTISDSPVGCIPRVEDITGCWQVQWERSFGQIILIVGQQGKLTGTYELLNEDDGKTTKGNISGFINGSNVSLVLNPEGSDKVPQRRHPIGALLEVQDDNRIVLCGAMSTLGPKPFITGGIWNADAPEAKVCSNANFTAFARSQ